MNRSDVPLRVSPKGVGGRRRGALGPDERPRLDEALRIPLEPA